MCKKCTVYAEHTTTAGKMGVSDPESGCICVGADTSAADGTDARSGYYTNPNATGVLCLTCPTGADCSDHGMGLVALTAKEGFWRSNRTSTVFTDCSLFFMTDAKKQAKKRCCPLVVGTNASICKGLNFTDPDSQCLAALDADANSTNEAYGGPACLACKNASYTMQDEANKRCSPCPGGSSLGGVIGALSGLMGVLWIGFAVLFYKANRNHDDGKAVEKKKKKKGC